MEIGRGDSYYKIRIIIVIIVKNINDVKKFSVITIHLKKKISILWEGSMGRKCSSWPLLII